MQKTNKLIVLDLKNLKRIIVIDIGSKFDIFIFINNLMLIWGKSQKFAENY